MRLKSFRVTEFKSVADSGQCAVGDVTCLVGKNEAGKTALLQALYRLNPVVPNDGQFDVTHDYPRADVEDYQQAVGSGRRQPALAICATYEIEDPELSEIEAAYGEAVPKREVRISRGYSNETQYEFEADEGAMVRHLLKDVELPLSVAKDVARLTSLSELQTALTEFSKAQAGAHKEALAAAESVPDEAKKAKAKEKANHLLESESAKQLRARLGILNKSGAKAAIWEAHLASRWPKFLYFDEYYQMEGQANIEALKARRANKNLTESDRPLLGLLDLARLDLDQIINATDTQAVVNKIEGASNHLSKQILKYWSQNKHIHMRFDVRPGLANDPEGMTTGHNLWGSVYDTKHLATTGLGTRSRGFVWFFSFLAWFSQQRKQSGPMVLLLDEPGLFLHASAQGDLLSYIEQELRPHHQVIYSTHSPFMVDATRFSRVRIVRDRSMESDDEVAAELRGTKVSTDVLEADEGSLFPLQGALGYDIAQTLFIGPNSLVVEGVSDLLYLQTLTGILQRKGRPGLDPRWIITPVGGAEKVPTFVALLGAQKGLKIATLLDIQNKDEQLVENLYKRKLLDKKHVLTFATFTGTTEADIEDMFHPDLYLSWVNAEFKAELKKPVDPRALTLGPPRILLRIEKYLQEQAPEVRFNHYRPARYFSENAPTLAGAPGEETLSRFEKVFAALNALL